MSTRASLILALTMGLGVGPCWANDTPTPISQETQACLDCHTEIIPGIVQDWLASRHAKITPQAAMSRPRPERRISTDEVDERLRGVVVGCYECHSLNPGGHKDNFEHNGYHINVIVSPNDCRTCHPVEANQYSRSKKAYAHRNLAENPLYGDLMDSVAGLKEVKKDRLSYAKASDHTKAETCYGCHGTEVRVKGMRRVAHEMAIVAVPELDNWPNQGVGRINPDGSLGSCAACHARHAFSIEVARKPYTCSQCHLEPDVPAWNVYKESKHGNICFSKGHEWNWSNVPWKVGADFKAPSCSVCHNSLIVDAEGGEIAPRTHDFGARLWVRLFGLIYSHAQPKAGDTHRIKNADGLPLPTTFGGAASSEYLIEEEEQQKRRSKMMTVCGACHSTSWVDNHFRKMDNTVVETDRMVRAATRLLQEAWKDKLADDQNPFDEGIEQMWMKQWLFYGNSVRYSSAMTGAPDYATFKLGWWELTRNLQQMQDWIVGHRSTRK